MNLLLDWDRQLFVKINSDWANPIFDRLFPAITDMNESMITWAIVLFLLAFWIFKQRERALRWIVVTIVAVGATDLIAYRVLKPLVSRHRPGFSGVLYVLRTNVHQGNSFPSNHAANMFALAIVLAQALPFLRWPLFTLAFLVAYSRVYVGVHFPIDILAGALTGLFIGWIARRFLGAWADRPTKSDGGSSRGRKSNRSL